ncbi:MAG: aminotransferase class I/II-fold pyridoxal phosphate-dependent enzyme [Mangrovibacterium sp.]
MNPQAKALNETIAAKNAVILDLLSEKGKNIFFPKLGILGQAADAKSTRINATIGTAVEDDGSPMCLKSISSRVDMPASSIFPYAPSFGRPDLRTQWQEMLVEKNPSLDGTPISLPIVTCALTHAVSMIGYLFMNEGDEIILPELYWGNYNLALCNAYGAQMKKYNAFANNALDLNALETAINAGGVGKKIIMLNFPNNPTGYSPRIDEAQEIANIMLSAAEKGNKIVAVCDDAYFGLVYEEGIEKQSIFSYLADLHENILAVKIDGPTKEDYVWGFRVGFITYGVKGGDAELYAALENKTAGAVRGNISNAANISQSLLVEAFRSETYTQEKEAKFNLLAERYQSVKEALQDEKYAKYFSPLPYNSGYFMCVQLAEGLDGEAVRKLLIEKYSIGVINLNGVIRVAFSAMPASQSKELFEGLYAACKELTTHNS